MCKVRALQILLDYCVNSSWSDDISVFKTAVKGTTCTFVSSTSGWSHFLACSMNHVGGRNLLYRGSCWSVIENMAGSDWGQSNFEAGQEVETQLSWRETVSKRFFHITDYIPYKVKGGLTWVMGTCLDVMLFCEMQRGLWLAHNLDTLRRWCFYNNKLVGLLLGWGECS